MRWEDESWVKLYTRDSGDWLFLSFDSQALFLMLLRKVDRHGVLELGRNGAKALASVLGHNNAEQRITTACNALIEDGCVTLEAGTLTIVNFKEAQAAKTSSAERSRRFVGLHGKRNAQQRATTRNNDQTRLDKTRLDQLPARSDGKPSSAPEAVSKFVGYIRQEWPDVKDPAAIERRAQAAFTGIDLLAEARKARGWELSDPKRRKHNHGKFLWGWLGRAQDGASRTAIAPRPADHESRPQPPPIQPPVSTAQLEAELEALGREARKKGALA